MASPAGVAEDVWSAIRSCEMLAEASDARLGQVAQLASVHTFHKGQPLLNSPTTRDCVGVVVSGRVRAFHVDPDGRTFTIRTSGVCEAFGMMAAITGEEQQTDFESLENDTRVLVFPREEFLRLIQDEPDILRSFVQVMARSMTQMARQIKMLTSDVPARVAIYIAVGLQAQCPRGEEPLEVDLGVSRVELAAQLATVPETLSRAFQQLQRDGIIQSEGQRVVVLNRKALIDRTCGVL